MEAQYLTFENNYIIYDRLKNEVNIVPGKTPYLWGKNYVGNNDICLNEENGIFEFYVLDSFKKKAYFVVDNIKYAVDHLVDFYEEYGLVDNPDLMKDIFYDTFRIENKLKR